MTDNAVLEFVARMREEASGPARALRRELDQLGGPVDDITAAIRAEGAPAAVADIGKVATVAEELAGRTFDPKIDADIGQAEAKVLDLTRELDVLRRMEATPQVTADIGKAEANLKALAGRLEALRTIRAEMTPTVDTAKAEAALDSVADKAASAGSKGGEAAGSNMADGIIGSLKSVPIAGAVIGVGVAVGVGIVDGIRDGLQVDVREDLFGARTGLDEATSARFGQAAGEAYSDVFGDSIAENLDAARVALQTGLLDPGETQRDATAVISSLQGVTDILGEEYPAVARAAGQAIKTGLADNAEEAFDLLVRGSQAGLNVSEDLLDTLNEYGTQFRVLGLDGEQALGLVRQAVQAGARDTDIAADSLKEFAIRASTDLPNATLGFEALGMGVEESMRKVAAGGPEATAVLDETLDRLRAIEDPVKRATVATALFGTQSEDMAAALMSMDLSTAVAELGTVADAADNAIARLGGNDAAKIEGAVRAFEVAGDGIKGALAAAFSDEIGGAAAYVARNREPMMRFMLDVITGAFDLGGSLVEGFGDAGAAIGGFLSGPGADFLDGMASMTEAVGFLFGADQETVDGLREAGDQLRASGDTLVETSDTMATEWGGALDTMRDKVTTWAGPELIAAGIHDAVVDAQGRMDELSASIDAAGGTVTINGDQRSAEQALEDIVANIDESDGTVVINGDKVPADRALTTVIGLINAGRGDVTIGGNATSAHAATDGVVRYANGQRADIDVGANDNPARGTVNALVREIAARRVDLTIGIGERPINRGQFATGGFTGAGGRYEVKGEVHANEFVFDEENTGKYRTQLAAVHAGVDPAVAFRTAAAPAQAGTAVARVTIRHEVVSPDGSVRTMTAQQLARMLNGDQQAAAIVEQAVRRASAAQAARTLTPSR